MELSMTTLHIIGGSKIILFVFVLLMILFVFKEAKPWMYVLAITLAVAGFYFILSHPLQKMFWANNGDEVFIFSFLTKVLAGDYLQDFYYSSLPAFYPPLYFWIIGSFSKFFTSNGISAAKTGVLLTLLAWFILPYFFQKIFWKKLSGKAEENKQILKSRWLWLIIPVVFFILLDFDAIILKPYETLPALLCLIFIGLTAESFDWQKWTWKTYAFFGISAGILFLTFYFWWIIIIPAIFLIALISKNKSKNIFRTIIFGLICFIISLPYLLPLTLSYVKHGIENWQAVFFVPKDLTTFAPWFSLNLKTILLIAGLVGLILFRKIKFVQAGLITFGFAFIYQFINIIIFTAGAKPAQSAKPFLFLGTACLAIGASYLIVYSYKNFAEKIKPDRQKTLAIILILIFIPLTPFVKFIDDPVIQAQIEKDLETPKIHYLADIIKDKIPDYEQKVWLSSGAPEINAYLPLSYFIAHNPHFSHHAANYSKRFEQIKKMTKVQTPEEFMQIIERTKFERINALLLYFDENTQTYPLFFWQDNFPNGGKELRLDLSENIINEKYWEKVYESKEWFIYIKK